METNKKSGSKLDTREAFWAEKLTDASWLDQFAHAPAPEIFEASARDVYESEAEALLDYAELIALQEPIAPGNFYTGGTTDLFEDYAP